MLSLVQGAPGWNWHANVQLRIIKDDRLWLLGYINKFDLTVILRGCSGSICANYYNTMVCREFPGECSSKMRHCFVGENVDC